MLTAPLPVRIDAALGDVLELRGLPPALEAELRERFTFTNPEIARRRRRGLDVWGLPERVAVWRYLNDGFVGGRSGIALPWGSLDAALELARGSGADVAFEDYTVAPPLELAFCGELRDYQERTVRALERQRRGIVVAPTGSGKTVMLAALVAQRKTTALVVVHTRPLLQQTARELSRLLGCDVGRIGDGVDDVRPVTVGLVQSVSLREDLADCFGLVVIDEIHHGAAMTWRAVIDSTRARARFGFTATPDRKDGMRPVVEAVMGPVAVEVPRWAAQAHLAPVEVVRLETGRAYAVRDCRRTWSLLADCIAEDESRHAIIAAEVRRRLDDVAGDRVLVLTDRIAHADRLAELLADKHPVVLTGKMTGRTRALAIGHVRGGARLTIGTVHLLGEGLDLPAWSVLVQAAPFAGGPRTAQAVGRVARPAPGKTRGLVVDLVDDHPALAGAWWARRKVYRQTGASGEALRGQR